VAPSPLSANVWRDGAISQPHRLHCNESYGAAPVAIMRLRRMVRHTTSRVLRTGAAPATGQPAPHDRSAYFVGTRKGVLQGQQALLR